jgi:starch phosphorylase
VPSRWIEMVRHTLKSLGPKVLATRMVRDYVRQLYTPAAVTGRTLNSDYKGATELAAWKKGVREGWADVRVEHVESHGVGDSPEVGSTLTVRAFVALGALTPDDVAVEVVHGVIDGDDELVESHVTTLALADSYDGGRHRFDGDVRLARGGSFGYTVRIVPRNAALAAPSEMGLVALP